MLVGPWRADRVSLLLLEQRDFLRPGEPLPRGEGELHLAERALGSLRDRDDSGGLVRLAVARPDREVRPGRRGQRRLLVPGQPLHDLVERLGEDPRARDRGVRRVRAVEDDLRRGRGRRDRRGLGRLAADELEAAGHEAGDRERRRDQQHRALGAAAAAARDGRQVLVRRGAAAAGGGAHRVRAVRRLVIRIAALRAEHGYLRISEEIPTCVWGFRESSLASLDGFRMTFCFLGTSQIINQQLVKEQKRAHSASANEWVSWAPRSELTNRE